MSEKVNDSDELADEVTGGLPDLTPPILAELAALAKAANRIADALERRWGLPMVAPVASDKPRPWTKGDRVRLGGNHGKVTHVGAAGLSITWDDGRYDLMLYPAAAKLVRL